MFVHVWKLQCPGAVLAGPGVCLVAELISCKCEVERWVLYVRFVTCVSTSTGWLESVCPYATCAGVWLWYRSPLVICLLRCPGYC